METHTKYLKISPHQSKKTTPEGKIQKRHSYIHANPHKQSTRPQKHQYMKLRIYLNAMAMSLPNFSRALSIISRGEAFSRSFAICRKSSSPFSTSAHHTPKQTKKRSNRLQSRPKENLNIENSVKRRKCGDNRTRKMYQEQQ